MPEYQNTFKKFTTAAMAVVFFFTTSCENNPNQVRALVEVNNEPIEQQEDLEMVYTELGYKRFLMKAPKASNFTHLERPYLEFEKGIDVVFFNSEGLEENTLVADYAIRYPNEFMWEARGNVVLVSKDDKRLETEKLYWNEKEEIIYSDDFVTIHSGREIIMGEGFEADQYFNNYKIYKITGELDIDED